MIIASAFFQKIASGIPDLKVKLKKADMNLKPEDLVKRALVSASYLSSGLFLILVTVLVKMKAFNPFILLLFPLLCFMLFLYMLKIPDVKIARKQKEITKEIVFAGRFLVIELESGVPLYNALENLSRNYETIGKDVRRILDKVNLGTSMEEALNETVELTPSDQFRKILWQIINSLGTGSDIAKSLSAVVDQISKEQAIEFQGYGKKLNPFAMFYMMIAVIAPTLGTTMLVVLSSFISFSLDLSILLVIAGMIAFVQFMFLSMMKFIRPPIDI